MNITFYGNGDSGNHGCEAIICGSINLLGAHSYQILSENTEQDIGYGLNELAKIVPAKSPCQKDFSFLMAYLQLKLTGNYTPLDILPYQKMIKEVRDQTDLALSVGGDNYCYGDSAKYALLNKSFHKNGMKTVLWGCSVEPSEVKKESVRKDLKRYDLIVARESITYDAVSQVTDRVLLSPDPAFYMQPKPCALPVQFRKYKCVGLNVSPMIVSNEEVGGITLKNYEKLIQWILENTDYAMALIPHVVWKSNDDRSVLKKLFDKFASSDRIVLLEDHNAEELKYIISHCALFVGARTHATIAAYSSKVPTLVVGYSVKARGIARDLFQDQDNYIIPVQSLRNEDDLLKEFVKLEKSQNEIRDHLTAFLPDYLSKGEQARQSLNKLVKG